MKDNSQFCPTQFNSFIQKVRDDIMTVTVNTPITIRGINNSLGRETVLIELFEGTTDLASILKRVFNMFEQTKGMEVSIVRELRLYDTHCINFYFPKESEL